MSGATVSRILRYRWSVKHRAHSRNSPQDDESKKRGFRAKSVSEHQAAADLAALIDASQSENVVITRNGQPSAILVGLNGYDAEDIELATSAEFWQMIENRRQGTCVSLEDVRARLGA